MSDVPMDPPPDAEDTAPVAWYARPITWIIAAVIVAVVISLIVVLSSDDDDGDDVETDSLTTSTTVEGTTTTVEGTTTTVAETTTTVEETTTTVEGPPPVEIAESPLRADLVRADPTDFDMPFEDGDVEAHWYQWDGTYVVVYAGWDATRGDPQCPGSLYAPGPDSEFEFISSSPQAEGACEPESRYSLIIPLDDPMGVRVCGTLVLNHTIIPVSNDDGTLREGELYGTVERIVDNGFVSSYGSVEIAGTVVAELDTTAASYSVPDGWLPDGATSVTC
jgi:hypothetical protein